MNLCKICNKYFTYITCELPPDVCLKCHKNCFNFVEINMPSEYYIQQYKEIIDLCNKQNEQYKQEIQNNENMIIELAELLVDLQSKNTLTHTYKEPEFISHEEFCNDFEGFDKITLQYHIDDEILMDSDNTAMNIYDVIDASKDYIIKSKLTKAYGLGENVYIRNFELKSDYKIQPIVELFKVNKTREIIKKLEEIYINSKEDENDV